MPTPEDKPVPLRSDPPSFQEDTLHSAPSPRYYIDESIRLNSAPSLRQQQTKESSVDLVAQVVADEMRQIQNWARTNKEDAQRDHLHFWMLKTPAILGGLGVSALESFGYGTAVIVLGFLTAVCVAIDGLHPRGRLYNVHKRAANELLTLQDSLATKWNQVKLKTSDSNKERRLMATMIEEVQREKQRISQYITNAEASLGEQDRASGS